ncbi:hypothetical protein [Pararhizobium sp.]|uniref:hypothetical protein n=1 Tax=Pararhizobium sp. TaxID=1977563 RepID=UPI003BA97EE8
MSLQHDTTEMDKNTVRVRAGGFVFSMRQMFEPFIQQLSESHHAYQVAETRKATRREISHLPSSLQQDLAFSDGTVIPFLRH